MTDTGHKLTEDEGALVIELLANAVFDGRTPEELSLVRSTLRKIPGDIRAKRMVRVAVNTALDRFEALDGEKAGKAEAS